MNRPKRNKQWPNLIWNFSKNKFKQIQLPESQAEKQLFRAVRTKTSLGEERGGWETARRPEVIKSVRGVTKLPLTATEGGKLPRSLNFLLQLSLANPDLVQLSHRPGNRVQSAPINSNSPPCDVAELINYSFDVFGCWFFWSRFWLCSKRLSGLLQGNSISIS